MKQLAVLYPEHSASTTGTTLFSHALAPVAALYGGAESWLGTLRAIHARGSANGSPKPERYIGNDCRRARRPLRSGGGIAPRQRLDGGYAHGAAYAVQVHVSAAALLDRLLVHYRAPGSRPLCDYERSGGRRGSGGS